MGHGWPEGEARGVSARELDCGVVGRVLVLVLIHAVSEPVKILNDIVQALVCYPLAFYRTVLHGVASCRRHIIRLRPSGSLFHCSVCLNGKPIICIAFFLSCS